MKTDKQLHAVGPMIGTTRSRVSFFMNRFRRWGALIIAPVMQCKLTVHFSTLFFTTPV
jgi:hypothetical protein